MLPLWECLAPSKFQTFYQLFRHYYFYFVGFVNGNSHRIVKPRIVRWLKIELKNFKVIINGS